MGEKRDYMVTFSDKAKSSFIVSPILNLICENYLCVEGHDDFAKKNCVFEGGVTCLKNISGGGRLPVS